MKKLISVCGSDVDDEHLSNHALEVAEQVGRLIARNGAVLVCGGHGGVMRAACKGAKEEKGITVGILPYKKDESNEFIDIALPTSFGYARNAMVACCADIIVALPGSHGTSSEISYGLVYKRPIIDLGNWNREGMIKVKDVQEAEAKIKELVEQIKRDGNLTIKCEE